MGQACGLSGVGKRLVDLQLVVFVISGLDLDLVVDTRNHLGLETYNLEGRECGLGLGLGLLLVLLRQGSHLGCRGFKLLCESSHHFEMYFIKL